MTTIELNVIGANPNYPCRTEFFTQKEIADAIQDEITGRPAEESKYASITPEFCNSNEIKAKYASGSLIGWKISEEAIEAFEAL